MIERLREIWRLPGQMHRAVLTLTERLRDTAERIDRLAELHTGLRDRVSDHDELIELLTKRVNVLESATREETDE